MKLKPSVVLIEGDTNSVLASALASIKSRIPIAHIESGLRSNDWKTVEEHNRKIVDHISDILFSPTKVSTENLQNENVHGKIHTVGNTVIDAISLCLKNIPPRVTVMKRYRNWSLLWVLTTMRNLYLLHYTDLKMWMMWAS